jgi:hypothetical protein
MKTRVAALLAVTLGASIACLSLAFPASARQAEWFVTTSLAERVTNRAYKQITPSVPMATKCYGVGGSLEPKYPGGQRFYQRFECIVTIYYSGRTPKVRVTFRVRNKHYATLQEGWGLYGRTIGWYRI